jgi:hypothetical protein
VTVRQQTEYPWDGRVAMTIDAERPIAFSLKLRRPGWLDAGPFGTDLYRFEGPALADGVVVTVNGEAVTPALEDGWFTLVREWTPGDRIELALPMPVRRVAGHPSMEAADGRAAIQRGPIVYSLEGIDNDGRVLDVVLPLDAALEPAFRPDLLGGVTVISGPAVGEDGTARTVTAVPYFAWANRERGEMVVWVRR